MYVWSALEVPGGAGVRRGALMRGKRIMDTTCRVSFIVPFCILAGCAVPVDDAAEHIETVSLPYLYDNALPPNGLNPNGLNPNGLNPNGLAATALDPSALSSSVLAAIQDGTSIGELSRQFLKYAVECALDSSQSFSFLWTDALGPHTAVYYGRIGLAPLWAVGPLDLHGQEMVSACLAARTNYYGVPVTISMRAAQDPLKTSVKSDEIANYANVEGVFWGNLFAAVPHVSACYKSDTVANSRAYLRDCAAGHVNADLTVSSCGMIQISGTCETRCIGLDSHGRAYYQCNDPAWGTTYNVITIGLP